MYRWWLRSSYESSAYAYVSQPITLDEQTQKMKQHLLQDIRRSAYVYRVDCGGCNACEIEILLPSHPYSTQNVLALRLFHHRVTPIFCYLLAQSPGRCVCLHFGRMSLPPIIKSVFPTARAVSAAVFSTISTASGGGSDTIVPIDVLDPRLPANTGRHHSRFRRGAQFAATEDSRCGLSRSHRGGYATAVAANPAITTYRH